MPARVDIDLFGIASGGAESRSPATFSRDYKHKTENKPPLPHSVSVLQCKIHSGIQYSPHGFYPALIDPPLLVLPLYHDALAAENTMEEAVIRQSLEVAEDAKVTETIVPRSSISSDTAEHGEKATEATLTREKTADYEYVTGIKLWAIVICVTLAMFLLLLDISIIGTVSYYFLLWGS